MAGGRLGGLAFVVQVASSIGPVGELGATIGVFASLSATLKILNGSALSLHLDGIEGRPLLASFLAGNGNSFECRQVSKTQLDDGGVGDFHHFNNDIVCQRSSFGETPASDQTVFGFSDIHKVSLDVVHVVLHDGEQTHSLAIVTQAIAGHHVGISPHSTGSSSALAEVLAVRAVSADSKITVVSSIASKVGLALHHGRGGEEGKSKLEVHIVVCVCVLFR